MPKGMHGNRRMIDANALKDRFNLRIKWLEKDKHDDYTTGIWDGCLYDAKLIDEIPTVDAVEVKCKVGDYVYALWEAPVKLKYIIYCAEVKEIRISMRNCRMTTTYILEPIAYRGHRREYLDEDFGTLVFKNEEDAERTLYPCEHCITGTYRSCKGCSCGERIVGE